MADLETLLEELTTLDTRHDLDGLRRVRQEIVDDFPKSEAAVEAQYKLGLDSLFRQRNLDQAVAYFEEAAKRKHPYWSAAARTSLGLCFYHQKKTQKALLELRKVAYTDKPNTHSVTALGFIETIYEHEGNAEELKRVRKDRVHQLAELTKQLKSTGHGAERGHYLYILGQTYYDQGDTTRAVATLEEAKALGPNVLGAELYRSVVDALNR